MSIVFTLYTMTNHPETSVFKPLNMQVFKKKKKKTLIIYLFNLFVSNVVLSGSKCIYQNIYNSIVHVKIIPADGRPDHLCGIKSGF